MNSRKLPNSRTTFSRVGDSTERRGAKAGGAADCGCVGRGAAWSGSERAAGRLAVGKISSLASLMSACAKSLPGTSRRRRPPASDLPAGAPIGRHLGLEVDAEAVGQPVVVVEQRRDLGDVVDRAVVEAVPP